MSVSPPGPASGEVPDLSETPARAEVPDAVDVYWRPGCVFCTALRRTLEAEGVVYRLHNIWEDDSARRFVRLHNRGNETVPTVAVGSVVSTNPGPKALVAELRTHYPHLISTETTPPPRAGRFGGLRRLPDRS